MGVEATSLWPGLLYMRKKGTPPLPPGESLSREELQIDTNVTFAAQSESEL